MTKMKKPLKFLLILLLILFGALALFLIYLTIQEYRPEPDELVQGPVENGKPVSEEDTYSILSFNTGYAGLGEEEDFFMDGGTKVQPETKEEVEKNLEGISNILTENPADAYFLQETDIDSRRSFHINEKEIYEDVLSMNSSFARNFYCNFVPYPLPPIGKVESGILTLTSNSILESRRLALPESFTWPIKTCNLKRCLLVTRIPVENSSKELVLINFHLEAYDRGEGKIAQSKMLAEVLASEYEKGNYVIAGGDFNQTFEFIDKYPVRKEGDWAPGIIYEKDLPEHFSFATDDSYPTCRLLNKPYTGSYETSQVYVIDGFIVSDNLNVKDVHVINTDFEYTDHQPVRLEVTFKK